MRKYDLYSSFVCFLVGLGFILGGLKYRFGNLYAPGPGFLPFIFGGVFSLLSIGLFFTTILAKIGPSEKTAFWKTDGSWQRVLYSLFSLVGYLVGLNYLGYLLTTFLFSFYLFRFIGKRKSWISIGTAAITSLISYLLFDVAMGVPLPKGLFIDWVIQNFRNAG